MAITIKGSNLNFFIPKDPIDILERELKSKGDTRAIPPYWADHWPSSETAIYHILDLLKTYNSTNPILELGSGIGVIATILAKNGYSITASDYSIDGCNTIIKNGNINNCSIKTVCLDWNLPPLKNRYATIIGIDILYDDNQYLVITNFLKNHLQKDGRAIIFDPNRPHWRDFKAELQNNNFNIRTIVNQKNSNGANIEAIEITFDQGY